MTNRLGGNEKKATGVYHSVAEEEQIINAEELYIPNYSPLAHKKARLCSVLSYIVFVIFVMTDEMKTAALKQN